jgi:aerobic-type carbon monoxide dehydrogenase small subunit (CoxS/CutS family)
MVTLIVNGKRCQVDAPADLALLWVIREMLSLTGT